MRHVQTSLDSLSSLLQSAVPARSFASQGNAPFLPKAHAPSNDRDGVLLEQWVRGLSGPERSHSQQLDKNDIGELDKRSTRQRDTLFSVERNPTRTSSALDTLGDADSDEEDPDGDEQEGLHMIHGILKREEQQRLRADGHMAESRSDQSVGASSTRRRDATHNSHPESSSSQAPNWTHANDILQQKRPRSPAEANSLQMRESQLVLSQDPVVCGLCTEIQGQYLFDL